MFKTISAALLAISVLAAPAMAAGTVKTTQAPVTTTVTAKSGALNAQARMSRHHYRSYRHYRHYRHERNYRHYHHRFHRHFGAMNMHHLSKVSVKHVKPAIKRG